MKSLVLTVRVIPRAGRSGLAGTRDNAILVRLTAPPVEGAANTELIELLADLLHVPKRSVTIVAGERGRLKRVRIDGVDSTHAARLLNLESGIGIEKFE
jgi:uncharacterized protein (TIGR00251 family)